MTLGIAPDLQRASEIKLPDVADLATVEISAEVNSMTGGEVLRAVKDLITDPNGELGRQREAVLATSRGLSETILPELDSLFGLNDHLLQGSNSECLLRPETLDKLVANLSISDEEKTKLREGLRSEDQDTQQEALQTLAEELKKVLSNPENIDQIYAIAIALAEDPAVSEDLRNKILKLAAKLAEELKNLRLLLKDELLCRFLGEYYDSEQENDSSSQHGSKIRSDIRDFFERKLESLESRSFDERPKHHDFNLAERIAKEREATTIEHSIQAAEDILDKIEKCLLFESNPSTRMALMDEIDHVTVQADKLRKDLVAVRGALSQLT